MHTMTSSIFSCIHSRRSTVLQVICVWSWLLHGIAATHTTRALADDQQIVLSFVDQPATTSAVVRLRDIVQVIGGKSSLIEQLLDSPLGPAPRLGQTQAWRSETVLEHLKHRGLHSESVRWSGATKAELQRVETIEQQPNHIEMLPAFTNSREQEQARNHVVQAISEYINLKDGKRTDWLIDVELPTNAVPLLNLRRNIISIGGGEAPWIGEQQFALQVKQAGYVTTVPIFATLEAPPNIVIAKRPIRRGAVITADMLTYAALDSKNTQRFENCFTDVEECVGMQARRSISTGQPVETELIGEPIVVNRYDQIEVESISGSVVVRTSAKALASGAVGDLIEIELPTRKRILATVVGPSMAQIAAVSKRTQP